MSAPDRDRLELDEHGRVVGDSGGTRLLDLADPAAAEDLSRRGVDLWVDRNVVPFLARHRAGVRAAAAVVAAAVAVGLWAGTRPPYVAPTVDVELDGSVLPGLPGSSRVAPEISADGVLAVALSGRAATPGERVDVLRLVGPGLTASAATGSVGHDASARVEASATIDCTDPALASATPASYALAVRSTSSAGDAVEGVVPLVRASGRPITNLQPAVLDWCLRAVAPSAVEIGEVAVTPVPGTTLADVSIAVRNASPLPLTMRTERRAGASVDVDLSPTVAVGPGRTAVLATRLNVHDCTAPPAFDPLAALPDAVEGSGGGIALGLALGSRTRVSSYPLPGADRLAATLASAACRADVRPAVRLLDVEATRPGSVTWAATAVLALRSAGKGLSLGRERFDGGPAGAGSVLTLAGEAEGGWAVPPVRLDGGAGRLIVGYAGGSCLGVSQERPQPVSVRVTMPDGTLVPYQVVVDDVRVVRAAHEACGIPFDPAAAAARGWVAVAPGA